MYGCGLLFIIEYKSKLPLYNGKSKGALASFVINIYEKSNLNNSNNNNNKLPFGGMVYNFSSSMQQRL